MSVMSNQDIDFIDYLDGYMTQFNDLNDGAWEEAVLEGVISYNKCFGRDLDPHKGYLHYIGG